MTLLELCEPLFQSICRLNRMGRSGGRPDYNVVHAEIKELLDDLAHRASTDARLARQAQKLELPMIFFIDSMIATSQLPFAEQWHQNRLAYQRNEKSGDEKFFDLLDATIQETGEEADERLAFFYVCLGLGFGGMYAGQPEQLRTYVNRVFPRIRSLVDHDPNLRVCEDAYKSIDSRNLIPTSSHNLTLIAVLFAFLALSVLVIYYGLYLNASNALRQSLDQITQHETK